MSRRKGKGKKRCGFFRRNISFDRSRNHIPFVSQYRSISYFPIPNQQKKIMIQPPEPGYSGGEDGFYVVDKARVLSDETKSFIEVSGGEALCASTKAQVAVVVDQDSGDDGIYPYKDEVDENKYGDVKLDNGVL